MPNPYDDLLNNSESNEQPSDSNLNTTPDFAGLDDPRFMEEGQEPLDEILDSIALFSKKAEGFSRLLSQLRVVDHKVRSQLSKLFLAGEDPHKHDNLVGEKKYHALLTTKFEAIIEPMQTLAQIHLQTVQQFNRDIDKNYYSIEKTDSVVKVEINKAIDSINLQRKILAEAATNLQVLNGALVDTEKRIKDYINAGGINNISAAEYGLLVNKREELSSGQKDNFDYNFFDVNIFDKTAFSFGIYLKETSTQYLSKLTGAIRMN